jgi:hypothetical protein
VHHNKTNSQLLDHGTMDIRFTVRPPLNHRASARRGFSRLAAMVSGQNNAANTAIKVKAVLSGKWIERAEIGTPGEFDAMTDEELERALIERVQKLGLLERVQQLGVSDFGESQNDAGETQN